MPKLDLRRLVQKLDGDVVVGLEEAVAIAVRNNHSNVEIEHWLLALNDKSERFREVVQRSGGDLAALESEAHRALGRYPRDNTAAPAISTGIIDVIREAWIAASLQSGRTSIGILDLLHTLLSDSTLRATTISSLPSARDIRLGELERQMEERGAEPSVTPRAQPGEAAQARGGDEEFLSAFTIDLTEQARNGEIDAVVGREAELRQLIDILVRRRQNNPILVGEAGVGKTAIVEAFALEIVAGNVPEMLRDIRLLTLDLGLLQAGAGVKGEFERRLKGVIDDVKASPVPVILFIDEAHSLVGAGGQAGQGDAANLLKPALARGELRTVAATTWAEYKKYFERDAALTRRFQVVKVNEPDEETAVRMVRSLVPALEKHHQVKIRDEAIRAAVSLSMRYIQGRQLPDKAVSLIDTASAAVSISRATVPAQIEDANRAIDLLNLEKQRLEAEPETTTGRERLVEIETQLTTLQATAKAFTTRLEQEKSLVEVADKVENAFDEPGNRPKLGVLEKELRLLQGESPLIHRVVDRETVAAVTARWTGIPVGRLVRSLVEAVQTLEARLQERVVGQDQAIALISDAMITARANLGDDRRPPGVFLMVGTSGVGKTETALALATTLYGGDQNLTIINMSEFKEEHKVSLLLGSPPGYVGYGEGGILTEAVRKRPYGVLLLDEIDKAHPGVQDIFYQVFDKGMLKDGEGRDIDFKNTTILMTANTGTNTLTALAADPETMPEGQALVEMLQPELLGQFKPAFLGRVTIVPYKPLDDKVLAMIAKLQIDKVRKRLRDSYKADLSVSQKATDALIARSKAVETGARAIESTISRELLPKLSRNILELTLENLHPAVVHVDTDDAGGFLVSIDPVKLLQDPPEHPSQKDGRG
ncbi:type VI secretion system ATPase TssH [Phyllobacterium myrsinacearum]|uniref:Type VI secretion system protein VasG n=1 Tax=Phyllobacterium myrsinacearum TaxID=28101 RepID=A0A839ELP5_9HYPH|nr:type VI secretion system ATPase TssH [Phyllobacterium myrsinacearum]MBA8879749.1 type VI secretion system protein VasG [Phyllobacterium myrsinacearum]